jgi:RNA polymerase sigma-70 factor, ECF subfamily
MGGRRDFVIDGVFEGWYGRLVRAMRRRLGDGDDAEDVVQEAFVRLVEADEGDGRPDNAAAWLFRVAGRLASDRRRGEERRARIARGLALDTGEGAAPDGAIERAETIAVVREVLGSLGERDRQLLLLHHSGLSYREIAERIAVAPASVGSLLTRAHRRFLAAYDARVLKGSRSALP